MSEEQNITLAVGRLEGKMDLMVTSVNNLAASFESLEKGRLSRVEIQLANLIGKITVIAAVAGFATSIVTILISHLLKF